MNTQAHAKACKAAGYGALADALLRLRRTGEGSLQTVLKGLCREYTAAFFPRYLLNALFLPFCGCEVEEEDWTVRENRHSLVRQ